MSLLVSLLVDAARQPLPVLGALALVLVVLLFLVRWLLARARRAAESAPSLDDLPAGEDGVTYVDLRSDAADGALAASFREAVPLLSKAAPGGDLYRTPWFLLAGETAGGKTTLAGQTGLALPFGAPPAAAVQSPRSGLNWWIFEPAVLLDALGSYVLRLDGQSSDEEGWLTLLRLLRRARPRRPIDGVVVAIPASVLVPGGRAQEVQAAAAQAGARIYSALLQAELILGMRFPVDVLVTRCDEIDGFTPFTDALPAGYARQIFGWSSPYPLDAPYQVGWVDEAYASIGARLADVTGSLPEGSGARVFPAALGATAPAAQVYLNNLFAPAALGEPLYFRGLYFCGGRFAGDGTGADSDGAEPAIACADGPEAVLFLHDLFADKVFPEDAIAQPTPQAVSSRKRLLRRLAALALAALVVGALGLQWGYRSVARQSAGLTPAVEVLVPGAEEEAADPADPDAWMKEVLAATEGVQHYEPRSLWLPPSWASPLHGEIREAFDQGYGERVFPALLDALGDRLDALEAPLPAAPAAPPALPEPRPAPVAVADMPEFTALADYVGRVTGLESAADSYSCIGEGCAPGPELVRRFDTATLYLYDRRLDLPNRATHHFYAHLFRGMSFAPWVYRDADAAALQGTTGALAGALYRELFADNPVEAALERMVAELDRLESPGGSASRASVTEYRKLDAEIRLAAWMLARPEYAWMSTDPLDLGESMDAVYAAIGASRYLGRDLRDALRAQADQEYTLLRSRLASLRSAATGPVLARQNGEVAMALSPRVLEVQKAVETYLGQTFIEPGEPPRLEEPEDWQRLVWDPSLLQQAAALVPAYDDYVAKELSGFPPDMRTIAQQVALGSLETSMLDLIRRAESFQVAPSATIAVPPQLLESDIAARALNFTQVSGVLGQLLDDFGRLELATAYLELAAVVEREEYQLLADTSALLAELDLYSPRGGSFAWWDGTAPPAPGAFGAASADDLDSYLAGELAAVTRLAQSYAQPVISAVAAEAVLRPLDPEFQAELDFWSRILTDIEQQKNKKAGNPVAEIQGFITGDLSQVVLKSCFAEPVPAAAAATPADWFTGRQALLETALRGQCATLARDYGYACYRQMAEVFEDRLAGRFPFADQAPNPYAAEAEPAALTDFFGLYDNSAWMLEEVPPAASGLYGDQTEAVTGFLAASAEVRAFLAPFLDDPKTYPVPALGFTVDFRVAPGLEKGAEDVIGWTLTVGRTAIQRGGATRTGAWTYGTAPATVALRWADDAPMRPVETVSRDLAARIDGRTVSYQYNDPWSLVALLVGHKVRIGGLPPETLRFYIQTEPVPAQPGVQWTENDLYIRISLTTPDGKQPILLPTAFPSAAPAVPPRPGRASCPQVDWDAAAGAPAAASPPAAPAAPQAPPAAPAGG